MDKDAKIKIAAFAWLIGVPLVARLIAYMSIDAAIRLDQRSPRSPLFLPHPLRDVLEPSNVSIFDTQDHQVADSPP